MEKESSNLLMDEEETRESDIARLWRKYGFDGRAPQSGSIAEARLKGYCQEYLGFVLNPKLRGVTGSPERQRELHSQIAMMVIGKSRPEMDFDSADLVANFASELIYGVPMAEIDRDLTSTEK